MNTRYTDIQQRSLQLKRLGQSYGKSRGDLISFNERVRHENLDLDPNVLNYQYKIMKKPKSKFLKKVIKTRETKTLPEDT